MNCDNCGSCCKFIELDIKDITTDLIKWFHFHNIEYDKIREKIIIPLRCLYLKNNRCEIYDLRPEICREFKENGEKCQIAKRIAKTL